MKRAIYILTAIFFGNFVGIYYGFYQTWWFDMSLHFLGGFFVAMLMVHYLRIKELRITPNQSPEGEQAPYGTSKHGTGQANYELGSLKKYLIIIGAVSFIGVVWEFAEYLASQTLIEPLYDNFGFRAYFIGDLDDTMNDLLMDVVGAFSWLAIFFRK